MASWEIWKLMNSIIFDNGVASLAMWRRNFRAQVHLQLVRVAEDKRFAFLPVARDSNLSVSGCTPYRLVHIPSF
jgi:hypothetical protein